MANVAALTDARPDALPTSPFSFLRLACSNRRGLNDAARSGELRAEGHQGCWSYPKNGREMANTFICVLLSVAFARAIPACDRMSSPLAAAISRRVANGVFEGTEHLRPMCRRSNSRGDEDVHSAAGALFRQDGRWPGFDFKVLAIAAGYGYGRRLCFRDTPSWARRRRPRSHNRLIFLGKLR